MSLVAGQGFGEEVTLDNRFRRVKWSLYKVKVLFLVIATWRDEKRAEGDSADSERDRAGSQGPSCGGRWRALF